MKYRKFGNTGLDISVIGIGTDQFSGSWGKEFSQEEVNKIIDRAREVITAVIMVGLQSHLIQKLEYLTHKHPFRFLNLYGD